MVVGIVKSSIKKAPLKVGELIELVKYKPSKKKIFLKPNILGELPPKKGAITHPNVVEGLIRAFQDYEIVIGEGNAYGTTKSTFNKTGYKRLRKEYNIELLDLDEAERFTVPWAFDTCLELPSIIKTHEYINVPTMKTHYQTHVTLGLKNQKGLLKVNTKRDFHRKWGLNKSIRELTKLVKPDFTLVDAIYCIEKEGPEDFFGKRKVMNLLIGGKDFIEVDNVCVDVMGFDITEIEHIPPMDFEIIGENLNDIKSNFVHPKPYLKALNLRIHGDLTICSGCLQSFDEATSHMRHNPLRLLVLCLKLLRRKDVLLGQKAKIPIKHGELMCFGDCTQKIAMENNLQHISGCPPDKKQILHVLLNKRNNGKK